MEEANSTKQYSEEELRDAGASALFVAYYQTAPANASARREVDSGPFSLEELNDHPGRGGSFFRALWNGNYNHAKARADSNNREILRELRA